MSEQLAWKLTDDQLGNIAGLSSTADRAAEIGRAIEWAVEKALAEQEARHKREVIEARIEELENWYDSDADDAIGIRLTDLRSDLAALDKEAKP